MLISLFKKEQLLPEGIDAMKLIVGLGNIGKDYAATRHNIGFMVADELARRWQLSFDRQARHAYYAESFLPHRVLLIKPTTYMNLSGVAVGEWAAFYHLLPEDIAVIQDDMDLPVGRLRVRRKGSAGGHRGVESVIEHLGSGDFPRFKIGIGHPQHQEAAVIDHVLHPFQGEDKKLIEKAVAELADALELYLSEGIEAAMQKYNAKKIAAPDEEAKADA